MKNSLITIGLAVAAFFLFATLTASRAVAAGNPAPYEHAANAPVAATNTASTVNAACAVELWGGKNFTKKNITIEGPAKLSSLKNLPGANGKNWNDEADSLRVGSGATVTAWNKKNFEGNSQIYGSGSENPNLNKAPSSLQIACK